MDNIPNWFILAVPVLIALVLLINIRQSARQ